ncbi:MAG: sodium:proton antiporter [Bacteroidota bacterium]
MFRALTALVGFVIGSPFFGAILHAEEVESIPAVPLYASIPFVVLLAAIALMPFVSHKWWERNYPWVSFSLGFIVVVYYLFVLQNSSRLFHTAYEYISFISLIGSLFVAAGGIHIRLRGRSTPMANVIYLAAGSIAANILGTTGASMLFIRPYLRVNKYRLRPFHVVFFIFLISNIGGALTPIGDPPLFMGYLKGIPFFWVIGKVWEIWFLVLVVVLAIFYFLDRRSFIRLRERVRERAEEERERAEVNGLHNLVFLGIIIAAVFVERPPLIREVIMWGAALGSYLTTKREVHAKNEFNFIPIKEVAILFAGIFATMIPALDWLDLNSWKLGITHPAQFFWGTGILSSFLDNTPTYLNFLSAAFGLFHLNIDNPHHMALFLENHWKYIQAISVGAVFFGAMTYIGNGPNFMVKSIAEQSGLKPVSFLGYMVRYSVPVLLPVFFIVWLLYFQ